jgi:histidine triad (HIT) family protein
VSCIFCRIIARELPASIVLEDERSLAFLDIHPWRPGHTLVIPKTHAKRVAELDADLRGHLFEVGTRLGLAVRRAGLAKDVHFVINDGGAANQSVPHVHLHVLPRTGGDFLKLLAGVLKHVTAGGLRPTPRETLDAHADAIRQALVVAPDAT